MAKNVGGLDRIARFVIGAALIYVAIRGNRRRRTRLSAFLTGGDLLYTATTQYCPANAALGIDTCPADQDRDLTEMPA